MTAATTETETIENLVIIGSGPAGYTAALYAGRANLKPLMFAGLKAGGSPGGQLMTTTDVENFPGFYQGIQGPELMSYMSLQALKWGAEALQEDVVSVDFSQRPFVIRSTEREVKAHSVIIATGAMAKRLGLPSEEQFWNRGISSCATCDGASPLFQGKDIAVVGGGDTAAEESLFLTKYASHVHLLVRRNQLRASKTMRDRLFNHAKITVHWNTEVIDAFGDEVLRGLKLKNNQTGEPEELPVHGLFYAIGHHPNTDLFQGQLELTSEGYIVTHHALVETNVAGVYAAGDVQDHEFRQAITAAGTGCMAAMLAERWLSHQGLATEYPQPTLDMLKDLQKPASIFQEAFGDEPETLDLQATRHQGGPALQQIYETSDRLILVKYTATWCAGCKALKPILDEVVKQFDGKIHYVEIDADHDPEVVNLARVFAFPTVQFYKQKTKLGELLGVEAGGKYAAIIQANL
jgi:thioredoxin reductase (NADPH)